MFKFTPVLLLLLLINSASAIVLQTSGRWIVDASNKQRVKLRCATWPGHLETNIPEGLQHQSVATIAQWAQTSKFNCVRLTFSIDMALSPSQPLHDSFTAAALHTGKVKHSKMMALYDDVVCKNPWVDNSTTTRSVFGKVVEALEASGIMVILDNHVSRAGPCCRDDDGNGWWNSDHASYDEANSRFFDTANWLLGLRSMAEWARGHTNIVGIALRSELRAVGDQNKDGKAWYKYIKQGAEAVRDVNEDFLIFVGGTEYGTQLGFLGDAPFAPNLPGREDKFVYEFRHGVYTSGSDCTGRTEEIGRKAGYLLRQGEMYTGPLFLNDFKWAQGQDSRVMQTRYAECIASYMVGNDAEWAYGAMQGSYYVLDGRTNVPEPMGLLKQDWSGTRNESVFEVLGPMFNMTQGPA